eukprot:GHRQ01002075.1.p1 GENE.GHRQ01002075.1~~GHRQ01002075.1.p1  ORF type:complete len:347 (+),score=147.22 GHRQ01002075.1:99-1139(+)
MLYTTTTTYCQDTAAQPAASVRHADFPLHMSLHVCSYLPVYHKPWARLLCKEACVLFRGNTRILLCAAELPLWVVVDAYKGIAGKERAKLLDARASAGDLESVAWLRSRGCQWTSSTATAAAAGGHLQLLQYMTAQLPPCPIHAGACAQAAAAQGHLPVLEFLLQRRMCSYFDIGVCAEVAARAGRLHILEWLAEQRPEAIADTGVCAEAAAAGQLEVLRFLQARNCPISLAVCAVAAAAAGHMHVLRWLTQQHPGCLAATSMDCLPTIVAAAAGQLAVLQFLRSLDTPARWCEMTAIAAAKGGQLACLAWLKAHGCPVDAAACIDAAARHCHPDVLQYLVTECMW